MEAHGGLLLSLPTSSGLLYKSKNHAYFSGLNSGVLLMNLTRLRNSTWKSDISLYQKLYGDKLLLGDQDLINIYFNFHPG